VLASTQGLGPVAQGVASGLFPAPLQRQVGHGKSLGDDKWGSGLFFFHTVSNILFEPN